MKKIQFYLFINKLYIMSFKNYLNHIKKNILTTEWFKKAYKEGKITLTYLSKDTFSNEEGNCYFKYEKDKFYFLKLFLIKFEYKESLENDYHLKLLNVNIKNETIFNVVSFLSPKQKLFLQTNHSLNINIIDRKVFIKKYLEKYNSYLDLSILSKILNYTYYMYNNHIYKLNYLVPKRTFIYSLHIKDLISSYSDRLTNDTQISELLGIKYNINISRRVVCDVRKKYLIPKAKKKSIFNFYSYLKDFNNNVKKLNKKNISSLENNLKGVYELSSNKSNFYPFLKNKIIYIGSSSNIKKRLKTYTSKFAHTKDIRNFLKENVDIYFRIIKSLNYKEFEKTFINDFIDMHGDLPKLNKQRVLLN